LFTTLVENQWRPRSDSLVSGDSDEGNLAERRYVVVVDLAPTAKQQRADSCGASKSGIAKA